jgi:LacI family transcriptional regulator
MVTMRDVAKAANVSIATISHVVNDTRYVSPAVRERVNNAIRELDYQHNQVASSLRKQKTKTIGVLVPNNANPYFAEVLAGIEAASYLKNYHIIMGNANEDPEREQSYLRVLFSRQVDGILLISTGPVSESLDLLKKNKTPVVVVGRSGDIKTVDEILTDNYVGGEIATRYLLELGHRRIACITGPSILRPSTDRVQGYRETLAKYGATLEQQLIVTGDFHFEGGYRAAQQLLSLNDQPTAIFACNDIMAIGAIAAIQDSGLGVPADISIIGYDNIPMASYYNPRLTTIAQPAYDLGLIAVERLLERIGKPETAIRDEILPVQLIERDSCRKLL